MAPGQIPWGEHQAPLPSRGIALRVPKNLFPRVLTPLSPPHPQCAASQVRVSLQDQALHILEGTRDGSEPSEMLWAGTEFIPRFIHSAAGSEPAPGASCQVGQWQTLWLLKAVERQGELAVGGLRQRLKGPTLLLRLLLGKALRFSLFQFERQEVGRAAPGMPAAAS